MEMIAIVSMTRAQPPLHQEELRMSDLWRLLMQMYLFNTSSNRERLGRMRGYIYGAS